MITQEYLKSILHYDPIKGGFTWINSNRFGWNGKKAGTLRSDGYLKIKIINKNYLCHRLAFLYMSGEMPEYIDHINGNKDDNSFSNLRDTTYSKNNMNKSLLARNTSGVKGVSFNKKLNKWAAYISSNNTRMHLGVFSDIAVAKNAVTMARNKLHGEFANHGEFNK